MNGYVADSSVKFQPLNLSYCESAFRISEKKRLAAKRKDNFAKQNNEQREWFTGKNCQKKFHPSRRRERLALLRRQWNEVERQCMERFIPSIGNSGLLAEAFLLRQDYGGTGRRQMAPLFINVEYCDLPPALHQALENLESEQAAIRNQRFSVHS